MRRALGMKKLAQPCARVPKSYGRTSISALPSSISSALLLPEPCTVTSTFALRAAATFLIRQNARVRNAVFTELVHNALGPRLRQL